MNQLKMLLKIAAGALAFITARIISALVFPFSEGLSALPEADQAWIFPAMTLTALGFSTLLFYVRRGSALGQGRLIILSGLVFLTVNTLQTQIETLYFRSAFPMITDRDMVYLFLSGILTTLVWIPAALTLFGRKAGLEPGTERDWTWEKRPLRYALAALAYLPFYLGFGYLAQMSPALRAEYAEWIAVPELTAWLPLWQVFRGAGFLTISLVALSLFPRRRQGAWGLALMLSLFISLELLTPSVLMSTPLRLVHFCEITLSMVLYGLTLSRLVIRKGEGLRPPLEAPSS